NAAHSANAEFVVGRGGEIGVLRVSPYKSPSVQRLCLMSGGEAVLPASDVVFATSNRGGTICSPIVVAATDGCGKGAAGVLPAAGNGCVRAAGGVLLATRHCCVIATANV